VAAAAILAVAVTVSIRVRGQPEVGRQNLELPKLPHPYRTVSAIVPKPGGRTMGSTNGVIWGASIGDRNVMKFVRQ
jgi:hypothetical protein